MQSLKLFQLSLPLKVGAELSIHGELLTLQYSVSDTSTLLGLPERSTKWLAAKIPRADNLWKTTCFEAFLNPVAVAGYFEFNFSLRPAWNVYEFQSYRQPQPPQSSQQFELRSLAWDAGRLLLTAEVVNKTKYREFNVSLTAIIEESNANKHYFAVTHSEQKPDFHAEKSFTLRRGSKS